ncbi:RNA polymerase sigma-54 factor RpoN [Brevinematales bacterium NS]|nr:RNA polymerase factor sigma-54 [Brevinematales bacterium]QJR21312.1 RNA polymerase sigma-54 factor RpoN [Brevinematales bacterium NS]
MKQQLIQDQRQILTPLLVQQMEILTLPLPELREKLLEEAERNPLIRLENPLPSPEKRVVRRQSLPTAPDFVFENQTEHQSLLDHVLEQIHFFGWNEKEEAIGVLLLTSLDQHGFFRQDIRSLIEGTEYTVEEVEQVRKKLMRLDPEGLGSQGVLEFLLFQAEEQFGKESLEVRILQQTADLLEKKQYSQIAKRFRVSLDEVEEAVKNLSELKPTPVTGWGETAMVVIPEAFVEVNGEDIAIRLNEYYIPEVRLDQYYISLYEEGKLPKEDKKFLRSNLSSAKQLIENLESRKEIVYKVIHAILSHQKEFFTKGPQYQKPLRLRDIAEEVEIHESTVSRVVKDKYIQVGGKIIPLKQFFSSSVRTATEEEVSSKGIQDMIANIIAQEDKTDPLSDEQIMSILQNKGIKVSRRTIAKYRGILGIPPAHARRVER